MTKAYVLMTAMPPTTGHMDLIRFAYQLTGDVVVIVSTQPHEPMVAERVAAIRQAVMALSTPSISVIHMDKTVAQDPSSDGFWQMWHDLMVGFGITSDDCIVASEAYGQQLAQVTGATFYPYDIDRTINPAKATPIRAAPYDNFRQLLPEFRKYLRTTVTIFGAESTGKTTLSRQLGLMANGLWVNEYARPYLENTVNEITTDSMTAIWRGQAALQRHIDNISHLPVTIQDTDLFSTVGYWQFPHWQSGLGAVPVGLVNDAIQLQSDIYIITKSTIPFEPDPLRYGGDTREGSDEYWIQLCKDYNLPYAILDSTGREQRLNEALQIIKRITDKKELLIQYDRKGL